MKKDLELVKEKININNYSLREIADFFEKFDGSIIEVKTLNHNIKIKISKYVLPHILGLQYAFGDRKDSKNFKGKLGFEKLKNGEISFFDLKRIIKNKPNIKIGWKMIENRIEYLPMFLNTLINKTRFKIVSADKIARNSKLKGEYVLFKVVNDTGKTVFPLMSLKIIKNPTCVIETFIVEEDISFIGALQDERILKIELNLLINEKSFYILLNNEKQILNV